MPERRAWKGGAGPGVFERLEPGLDKNKKPGNMRQRSCGIRTEAADYRIFPCDLRSDFFLKHLFKEGGSGRKDR